MGPYRDRLYRSELERADWMARIDRSRYWAAYRRGVQRGVCGAKVVPDVEHRWRLGPTSGTHPEDFAGYVDGLKFAGDLLAQTPASHVDQTPPPAP